MAEFNSLVTTTQGQELFADSLANEKSIKFTKIKTSNNIYINASILDLLDMENIKQTVDISRITKLEETQLEIEVILQNLQVTEAYNINSIGLYAKLNEENSEEVLYGVASVSEDGKGIYMPEYNNINVSGVNLKLNLIVSSTSNVDFTVNPATPVTQQDFITFINNSRCTSR